MAPEACKNSRRPHSGWLQGPETSSENPAAQNACCYVCISSNVVVVEMTCCANVKKKTKKQRKSNRIRIVRDNLIYSPVGFGPFGPLGRGLLGELAFGPSMHHSHVLLQSGVFEGLPTWTQRADKHTFGGDKGGRGYSSPHKHRDLSALPRELQELRRTLTWSVYFTKVESGQDLFVKLPHLSLQRPTGITPTSVIEEKLSLYMNTIDGAMQSMSDQILLVLSGVNSSHFPQRGIG